MALRTAIIVLLGLVVGCLQQLAGCPVSGWTPEAEALAGTRAASSLEARYGGVQASPHSERRLLRIGRRLAAATPGLSVEYRYAVLDSPELNAFSLPVGRIYLTRGLYDLLTTDAMVAAVLAHEMAHLAARDSFKPRCCDARAALERELAADRQGQRYLQAAGYSAAAMKDMIKLIRDVQPAGWSEIRLQGAASVENAGDRRGSL
jgi:predicted Zn-dependent protease